MNHALRHSGSVEYAAVPSSERNHAPKSERAYRPDIDGLRAVAVLAVVLFHLNKQFLPGGFIGVDVFFVISGFLITSHIVNDVERARFSLIAFYSRRVKRIAPAMFVVVAITLLAAKLFLLPEDAAETSKSGVWSLASLANVFFWRYEDTGYFAAQSKSIPLLHLWSLGVEEQFYIVWPVLLMLFYRVTRARPFLLGMAIVAALSFIGAEYFFARDPSFVYYMLPTRAGELLIGAMATNAVVNTRMRSMPQAVLGAAGIVGMILILGSVLLLTEDAVFPGLRAVPPTLGTALVLLHGARGTGLIARLLSVPVMTRIGLVSYSAYLWHWPLITFYHYGYGAIGIAAGVALFVLTIALAALSYRFVERPARHSKAPAKTIFIRQYFLPAGAIGAFALAVVYADRVVPSLETTRYRQQLGQLRDQSRPAYAYPYVCQRQHLTNEDVTDPRCVLGADTTSEPEVVLWGDSNAAHYVGVLGTFARQAGFSFRNVEVGSCPPLLVDPSQFVDAKRRPDCVASAAVVKPTIDRASVVIISGAWSEYQTRTKSFLPAFYETVRSLTASGKSVILIGKVPVLEGFDRRCREKALAFPFMRCSSVRAPMSRDVVSANEELRRFAAGTASVKYFDVNEYLCPDAICSTNDADGELLYYDPTHLSLSGSWKLGRTIVRIAGVPAQFARLGGRTPHPGTDAID